MAYQLAEPLTEAEQHQIAVWISQFYPLKDIPGMIQRDFGKKVARTYAHEFARRKKWQPLIERLRQEWAVGISQVPIANKRWRLEELMKMYEQTDDSSTLRSILRDAREEMDEKTTEHSHYYFTAINNFSDEELLKRREELLKKIGSYQLPKRMLTNGGNNGVGNRLEISEEAAS